jgi:hypothetical protein
VKIYSPQLLGRRYPEPLRCALLTSLLLIITIDGGSHAFAQTSNNNYYENAADGIRVQISDGWLL